MPKLRTPHHIRTAHCIEVAWELLTIVRKGHAEGWITQHELDESLAAMRDFLNRS